MIDWLRTVKSAHFHKKAKRLPKKAIVDLFRAIRQNSEAPSNNIFHHVKESLGQASWSALAFLYERDPSFFDSPDAGEPGKSQSCQQNIPSGKLRHMPSSAKELAG